MDQLIDEHQIDVFRQRCQTVLDVRSPKEYAEDHFPGAINIPALTNIERAQVGTMYRSNPFEARKVGAALILGKIENFIQSPLVQQASQSHAFLLYCARGGQRSGALASVLSQIGFPVFRLVRGYKTYRAYIQAKLIKLLPQPVFILHGYTGSRKTNLLHQLGDDANVLDLEGAAKHRGSVLGQLPQQPQPTQRRFETELVEAIHHFRQGRPTLIEGESRLIGKCRIPDHLWVQIRGGLSIWLELPRDLRRKNILQDYHHLKATTQLTAGLASLRPYIPAQIFLAIKKAMGDEDWDSLVDLLLSYHYDPLYQRVKKKRLHRMISVQSMDEAHDQLRRILA